MTPMLTFENYYDDRWPPHFNNRYSKHHKHNLKTTLTLQSLTYINIHRFKITSYTDTKTPVISKHLLIIKLSLAHSSQSSVSIVILLYNLLHNIGKSTMISAAVLSKIDYSVSWFQQAEFDYSQRAERCFLQWLSERNYCPVIKIWIPHLRHILLVSWSKKTQLHTLMTTVNHFYSNTKIAVSQLLV